MTDRQKLMIVWPVAGFFVAMAFGIGVIATAAYQSGNPFSAAPAAAGDERIEVELGELFIEPAVIRAPAGAFTLEVHNGGAVHHDFAIPELGLSTPMLDPGESYSVAVDAPAGAYEFLCEVPGHADGGMKGTLEVGDATSLEDASGTHDPHAGMTPEEMAEMDAAVVAQFPAETEGRGGELLGPTIAPDGAKVFELTASQIEWETEPGITKTAYAYNEMVPGPTIEADLGDRVRIELTNELPEPTVLHLHGLVLPNAMDGVAGITQDAILPGESFSYEFRVRNTGSHMYHSHFMADRQVPMGLLGAFIVEDSDDPPADVDYTMVLNDGPLGYTINGKGFPATEPVAVEEGQTVRVRYMNEGLQVHPMHLHGMPQQVIAKDGYLLPRPYTADTVMVAPGDRVDVLVEATERGAWAWHCHVLTHVEGPKGMFGMVTALIVEQ